MVKFTQQAGGRAGIPSQAPWFQKLSIYPPYIPQYKYINIKLCHREISLMNVIL